MSFILDLLKKLLKILVLYIVIGFVAVILISSHGAFESLMINNVLGDMSTGEYIMLRGYVEILWFPLAMAVILSKSVYFPNPMIKILLGVISVVFFVGMIRIALKE